MRRTGLILLGLGSTLGLTSISVQAGAPVLGYEVRGAHPHDRDAFTQGLIFRDGFLYEGTGIWGESSLRKVELTTGTVLLQRDLPAADFGEGITSFRDTLLQITWQNHVGYAYAERDSFELVESFPYPWEGWGLTHDGESLIVTDGSATMRFLDPVTRAVVRQVQVEDDGVPAGALNELEYIDGRVYANVLPTSRIAVIDPAFGHVEAWIDLGGLQDSVAYDPHAYVLNGIAFDAAARRLFVTGKWWPKLFEIDVALLHPESVSPMPARAGRLLLSPNPAIRWVDVFWARGAERPAVFRVFDPRGRVVVIHRTTEDRAARPVRLDLGGLPSGVYFVRADDLAGSATARLCLLK